MKKTTDRLCSKHRRRHSLTAVLVLVFVLLMLSTACSTGKSTPVVSPPVVAITSPAGGLTVQAGVDVPIDSTANDTQGILKVELWVDGSLYRVDASSGSEGQTTFLASQPWHAAGVGSHTMVVKAHSKSGQVAESIPVTIEVLASSAAVPTDTPTVVAPTDTPVSPVATDTPPLTDTPVPPMPTNTPLPPTLTDTPTLPPEPTDTPLPPEDAPPLVKILVPDGDVTVVEKVDLIIRVRATDDKGVSRVELWVDGALHETHEVGEKTPVEVDLGWKASGPGDHVLEVKAFDTASQASQTLTLKIKVIVESPSVPDPFLHVWTAGDGVGGRLGNPTAEAVLDRWVADQFFEGGLAFWRNNESVPVNYVYVLLYGDGTDETEGRLWFWAKDLWQEGMPEFSCPEAEINPEFGPKRGFGKVWCEQASIRDGLKLPVTVEQGANAGFQDFENGTMLWVARLGYVYVLYDDGDWQRFDERP